jgi:hypothetical protein
MLQRNPNLSRNRRAGVIGACVVSSVALATLVIASRQDANDEPSRSSPAAGASEAEARQQAIEDAAGSDRHLELLAAELANEAEARQQAMEAEARQQAIEDAARSDRHLELLAAELASEAEARQQAIEDAAGETPASEAEQVASRFVSARNAWDATTVRLLLADDAVIDEVSVASVADYPARVEMERIRGWSFLQPQCTTTEVGPPARVTCTYTMEDAITRALGVGPFTGSSFEFVIADEHIQDVTHDFDFSQYSPQAFEVMWDWLDDVHPGDTDVIWAIDAVGRATPKLTPEALALLELRIHEFVAVAPAIRFIDARNTWDGETVRSLVADDAEIASDFAVADADDYLVNAAFERALQWRFGQPRCSVTLAGPPALVTCPYVMENTLTRALGVGPFIGSSFEFEIADGRIQRVTHTFDYSQYSGQAFEVLLDWLVQTHPGDFDVMFATAADGSNVRSMTPEALTLFEQRIPEFVASVNGS